jgi:ribosomal-protein-alanine N-acetyltransferase
LIHKFQRRTLETGSLFLLPYDIKFYIEVFDLIQKNKERLQDDFHRLLRSTETLTTTKDYVQNKMFDWNKNKSQTFHVFEKKSNLLIGHFNIKDIDWKKKQAELSYFIDVTYEKKGLMSEALLDIEKYCFKDLQLQHIIVRILSSNIPSVKLVEKCGFKYEGAFFKETSFHNNQISDTHQYGISKDDFDKLI